MKSSYWTTREKAGSEHESKGLGEHREDPPLFQIMKFNSERIPFHIRIRQDAFCDGWFNVFLSFHRLPVEQLLCLHHRYLILGHLRRRAHGRRAERFFRHGLDHLRFVLNHLQVEYAAFRSCLEPLACSLCVDRPRRTIRRVADQDRQAVLQIRARDGEHTRLDDRKNTAGFHLHPQAPLPGRVQHMGDEHLDDDIGIRQVGRFEPHPPKVGRSPGRPRRNSVG